MDARGTSAWRKKRTARPPRATKSGAPRTTARRRVTTAAANGMPPRISPEETNATAATATAATAARIHTPPCARRTSRHAMRAKPTGITPSATHKGRNGTTEWRSAHSARTSWRPDPASRRETAAETAATKADRTRRYGSRNRSARCPIERSRSSRAAIAPPSRPIHRVACWTRAPEPVIARPPDAAPDDLQDRQHGHADEQGDRNRVLDAVRERRRGAVPRRGIDRLLRERVPEAVHNGYRPAFFPPCCAARYSSRYRFTVSNASAGMIFPRTWG